ncbi:porin [Chitinophaga niabensis]|uniref:Opacity protein n=1 Tax=Chitinophaga niabensis TaxID=536979 RepID=A0A1N6JT54_9BACT|nr:porin [Chitinophaga niabensis]SIO47538.1 Opacity protein [Chitinophaga niabensis]
MRSLIIVLLFVPMAVMAQRQQDTVANGQPIIPVSKQSLLSNIDMIANMQVAFRNEFSEGTYQRSRFTLEQFRLEIKGKVHEKVYFRFRDRYTRNVVPQSIDNISRSTDMAYLRFDPTPNWKIYAGKMSADWGGYEFDANPIDIYEYSDIVEYADNFLAGVGVGYVLPGTKHEFTLQLLNTRTASFYELYDTIPGIKEARFPFAAVANWRGSFFNGKLNTIWSYSLFREAEYEYMNYFALGNQLNLDKVKLEYDFKFSQEQLDRKGIVSGFTENIDIKTAQNVRYVSHWAKVDVRVSDKVNVFFVGMLDDAFWKKPTESSHTKLRQAWGYIPGLEVYPVKNFNLKVFGAFIGRVYKYTESARQDLGQRNTDNYRISVGVISPLVIL